MREKLSQSSPESTSESSPSISIIIPSLNSSTVDRTVDAIEAQLGAEPGEILVVGKDEPGRLTGDTRVRLIETDGPRLPGAARNIGVQHSMGDLLVFVDADCEPEPGWLAAHVARHQAGESVVGGAVCYDAEPYWQLSDNLSMFHECDVSTPAGPRAYLPTLNLSVDRAVFDAVGLMDPDLPSGEDIDWTVRAAQAGHPPYFEPAARLWHRPPRVSVRSVWSHWYRSGRWMVGVRQRHPSAFGVPTWIYRKPILFVLTPAIALRATLRLFEAGRPGRRHPRTLPAVFLTKIAWCCGLCSRRRCRSFDPKIQIVILSMAAPDKLAG